MKNKINCLSITKLSFHDIRSSLDQI